MLQYIVESVVTSVRMRDVSRERTVHSVKGVFCRGANRTKLRYETEEKALNAVRYGNGDLVRVYFCKFCRCWHTTSKPDWGQPWQGMADYISDLYDIDSLDETREEREEQMVYVKLVENEGIGRVILPAHFPIGVLAKRFGFMRQLASDSHTRLTDVDAYLVLEEGKLVLKPLKDSDKEGFLQSFAARIEDQLEATNNFTMEHAIFPKDILREEELPGRAQPEVGQEPAAVPPVRPLPVKTADPVRRLDPSQLQENFSKAEAQRCLQDHLNAYLQALGLKSIDYEKSSYDLNTLAIRGKGLLTYAVAERFPRLPVLESLLSQTSIQLGLGRLGFYEFLEADAHLAAVFFEALYAAAAVQGRHEVRRQLEEALTGSQTGRLEGCQLVFQD